MQPENLTDLQVRADSCYCGYINDMMKPECLGWEQKVKIGKFGKAELDAHIAAAIKLGRHQGLMEAIGALSVSPHDEGRTT